MHIREGHSLKKNNVDVDNQTDFVIDEELNNNTNDEEDEYEIDKIKEFDAKNGLYRVSWVGYPNKESDTMEPYDHIKNTKQYDEFLVTMMRFFF